MIERIYLVFEFGFPDSKAFTRRNPKKPYSKKCILSAGISIKSTIRIPENVKNKSQNFPRRLRDPNLEKRKIKNKKRKITPETK